MLFSCGEDEYYKKELKKYLITNIDLNQVNIERLNSKYLRNIQEKPSTEFPHFKFIDSLYTSIKSDLNTSIKDNMKSKQTTLNNYKALKDTVYNLRSYYTKKDNKLIW